MNFKNHALLGCVRNQMIVFDVIPTGIPLTSDLLWPCDWPCSRQFTNKLPSLP